MCVGAAQADRASTIAGHRSARRGATAAQVDRFQRTIHKCQKLSRQLLANCSRLVAIFDAKHREQIDHRQVARGLA
jgi:hypothetical protein